MNKKIIIVSILVLGMIFKTFAKENNWHFLIEPLLGVQAKTLDEIVLVDNKELSELNWSTTENLYLGLLGEIGYKNFSIETQGKYCVSSKNGSMEDSDFLNLDSTKINYSRSLNQLNTDFSISSKIKFNKKFNTKYALSLFIGFDFNYINYSAIDGYGSYGDKDVTGLEENVSFDSKDARHFESGELFNIDYERNTWNILFGISNIFYFNDKKYIALEIATSPVTFINSIDTHHGATNNVYYYDSLIGSFAYYDISLKYESMWSKHFIVGVKYDCNFLRQIIGTTEIKNDNFGKSFKATTNSAAKSFCMDVSLFLKIAL